MNTTDGDIIVGLSSRMIYDTREISAFGVVSEGGC